MFINERHKAVHQFVLSVPEKPRNQSKEHMKSVEPINQDELRPEYDLNSLRVRRLGEKRKSFAEHTVRLEPDVAQVFPSADADTARESGLDRDDSI